MVNITPASGPATRPARILRGLADNPAGLSNSALVTLLGEDAGTVRQRVLCWYNQILAKHADAGNVIRTGLTAGGRRVGKSCIWQITSQGRAYLAALEALPQARADAAFAARREAAAKRQAEKTRAGKLTRAAASYGPDTPRDTRRVVAADLRKAGCTLAEIAQVFGKTREAIRLDLLPGGRPSQSKKKVA